MSMSDEPKLSASGDGMGAQRRSEDHPSSELLHGFAADTLQQDERTSVLAHLNECAACREALGLISPEEGPPAPIVISARRRA